MANTVRLWDTLFADPIRYDFLMYISVATVQQVRGEILEGDFADCMESLQGQTKKVNDVQLLIDHAIEVKEFYEEKLLCEQIIAEQAASKKEEAKKKPKLT